MKKILGIDSVSNVKKLTNEMITEKSTKLNQKLVELFSFKLSEKKSANDYIKLFNQLKENDVFVREANFDESISSDVRGVILRKEESYNIYLNAKDDFKQKIYTFWHEMAHLILHDGTKVNDYIYDFRLNSNGDLEREKQADYFVECLVKLNSNDNYLSISEKSDSLLIPEELLLKIYE